MPILGIGTDIVHIPRILALVNRRSIDRFARRILSIDEHADWQSLRVSHPIHLNNSETHSQFDLRLVRFLAVRWSVKEAAYKALYPAYCPTWKELTYHAAQGRNKPMLKYHPFSNANVARVGFLHVSVSHDGEYVVSNVLAEGIPMGLSLG